MAREVASEAGRELALCLSPTWEFSVAGTLAGCEVSINELRPAGQQTRATRKLGSSLGQHEVGGEDQFLVRCFRLRRVHGL